MSIIDITELVAHCEGQMTKLSGKKNSLESKRWRKRQEDDMQDSALMIPVRLSYYSGKETSTYLAQEHAHKYIQDSIEDVSVHELCETEGACYRFFMDIDKPKDEKIETPE